MDNMVSDPFNGYREDSDTILSLYQVNLTKPVYMVKIVPSYIQYFGDRYEI